MTFNVFNDMRSPDEIEECSAISVLDSVMVEKLSESCSRNSTNLLVSNHFEEGVNEEVAVAKIEVKEAKGQRSD